MNNSEVQSASFKLLQKALESSGDEGEQQIRQSPAPVGAPAPTQEFAPSPVPAPVAAPDGKFCAFCFL